jgi:preprotein translocase subunit SecG
MLHTLLMIVHFFCAAAIVALVLLQRGKGADAGAGFGAGASGTVFGARGATTALSRATAILTAIFMVTSLSLAYVGTRKAAATGPSGLLQQFSQPAAPSSATKQAPAGTVTLPAAPQPDTSPAPNPPVQAAPPAPTNAPAPK